MTVDGIWESESRWTEAHTRKNEFISISMLMPAYKRMHTIVKSHACIRVKGTIRESNFYTCTRIFLVYVWNVCSITFVHILRLLISLRYCINRTFSLELSICYFMHILSHSLCLFLFSARSTLLFSTDFFLFVSASASSLLFVPWMHVPRHVHSFYSYITTMREMNELKVLERKKSNM